MLMRKVNLLLLMMFLFVGGVHLRAQDSGSTQWYIDFSQGELPFGTTTDGNIYFGYSNAYTIATVRIISPKLDIQEGEKLVLNVRNQSYYSSGTLKVLYSEDKNSWTEFGDYSSELSSSQKDITVSGMSAGIKYVAVECNNLYLYTFSGYTRYFAENDVMFDNVAMPETGMVNNDIQISANIINMGAERAAGSYTIEFLVDGETVATADDANLGVGETRAVEFGYTPHAEGTIEMKLRYTCGDYVVETEAQNVEVGAEVAASSVQVGEATGNDMNVPFSFMYKMTHAETIYSAADLKLKSGDKITKIGFHGYNTSEKTLPVKIWAVNTDEAAFSPAYGTPFSDTEGMTLVYDGTATFKKAGAYKNYSYTYDDMVELELSEPFVYTGSNIKFVYTKEENDGGGLRYETSTSLKATSPSMYTGANYTVPTTMSTASATPVLYLTLSNDPATMQGKVTNKKNGAAVEGASIVLTSGNVQYSATTDAEGNYNIEVVQTGLEYDMTAEKEGFFPQTGKISFAEGSITKDIVLIESKDLFIAEYDIPAEAVENHNYKASIKIENVNATPFAADAYTVKFYFNDEVYDVETVEIPAGGTVELTTEDVVIYKAISTGGNKAMTIWGTEAYFEVMFGEETLTTDKVDVNVNSEELVSEVSVGEYNNDKHTAPINMWYKASMSESLYPAELMSDIEAGAVVTRLTYKGKSVEAETVDAHITVWMENVENGILDSENLRNVEEMQKVFDGNITIAPSNNVVLNIPLDEPFIYEGNDVRIVVKHTAATECKTNFHTDNTRTALCMNADSEAEMKTIMTTEMPVVYMSVDHAVHISGKLTDCYGNAVEDGVYILLTADNGVAYFTNAKGGTYDISVGRSDLTYTLNANVWADGYRKYTAENISFADGNVTHDIQFFVDPTYTVGKATTVCLPIALNAEEAAQAGKFYELYYADEENINFIIVEQTEACVPYMFVPATERPFKGMLQTTTEQEGAAVTKDGVDFIGVLKTTAVEQPMADGEDFSPYFYYYDEDAKMFVSNGEFTVPMFQAYIGRYDNGWSTTVKLWDEPNAIAGVATTEGDDAVYTLDGRRVNGKLQRGIYIKNGKKIAVK